MAVIYRNRVIRPSSRFEQSIYKIDVSNVSASDTLKVALTHESNPEYIKWYVFQGAALVGKNSVHFKWVNGEIEWIGATPEELHPADPVLVNLIQDIRRFTEDRDWDQFHNPKDLAVALSIEASELLEAFLWKRPEEAKREKVKEELADVFNYALLLADKYGFDVEEIVREKMARNAEKYPVEKARGVATKYNEL